MDILGAGESAAGDECWRRPNEEQTVIRRQRFRRAARASGVAGVLSFGMGLPAAVADDAKLLAYGKHLAGECTACHRIDGVDNGIPSITGWPVEHFVITLGYYRTGARPNPAMVSVASSLDEEQMKALATYYGSLPKPPRRSGTK